MHQFRHIPHSTSGFCRCQSFADRKSLITLNSSEKLKIFTRITNAHFLITIAFINRGLKSDFESIDKEMKLELFYFIFHSFLFEDQRIISILILIPCRDQGRGQNPSRNQGQDQGQGQDLHRDLHHQVLVQVLDLILDQDQVHTQADQHLDRVLAQNRDLGRDHGLTLETQKEGF